jgi:hypothetical protein
MGFLKNNNAITLSRIEHVPVKNLKVKILFARRIASISSEEKLILTSSFASLKAKLQNLTALSTLVRRLIYYNHSSPLLLLPSTIRATRA